MGCLQEVVLELTDWCPQHCRHCSSSSGRHCANHLGRDLSFRLLREATVLGAQVAGFGGGEPTASPIFGDVLQEASALGLRVEVYTCGVGANVRGPSPLAESVVASLAVIEEGKVIFSVHAPDAEAHDRITGLPGSFDCLSASMERCAAAGIRCEMNFVPIRPNASRFAEVVDLAEARGVRRLSVLRFVPQGRGFANRAKLALSLKEEDTFVAALVELRRRSRVEIRTGSPFNGIIPGNRVPCRAGAGKLVIQADGNVLPCEVFKHDERRDWGQSVHDRSLSEVIESPQFRQLRQRLERADCMRCPVHKVLRERLIERGRDTDEHVPEDAVHA